MQINLETIGILTIFNLPIHEHISFHLFRYSLISFNTVQYTLNSTAFVKYIPKCFVIFDAIINGIVFLASFSEQMSFYFTGCCCLC
jgi:hypothetical protein